MGVAVSERGSDGNLRRDIEVVSVVSLAHFFSHFYQFILPPLFFVMQPELGVSFAELGLIMTVFYVCSGVAQTAAGFLVDRLGPPQVLAAGLGLLAASVAAMALAPSWWLMLPAAACAGLGNSVFHPADYSIMNNRVAARRIGRAFSVHQLCGTIGYAAAPAVMVALAHVMPWRTAMLAAAVAGGIVCAVVVLCWPLLAAVHPAKKAAASAAPGSALGALTSPTVLICFFFFALMAMPSVGATSFLAATLDRLYGTPLAVVAAALTFAFAGSGIGTLVGGILADRTTHHERIVALGASGGAVIFLVVGLAPLGVMALAALLAVSGFATGIIAPSRDMLVRAAAAKTSTGKVFGFVYSGYDLGAALAPPLLGFLIDHGQQRWVMPAVSASLVVVILSALALRGANAPRAAAAPAAVISGRSSGR